MKSSTKGSAQSSSSVNSTTVGDAIQWGEVLLGPISSSAKLDSEVLLAHALGLNRTGLIARLRDSLTPTQYGSFSDYIGRRKRGEPVAYIIGEREFFGLMFKVTPEVLIPRPESELLVEEALKHLRCIKGQETPRVLDLGTGSGCLAISILAQQKIGGFENRSRDLFCDAVDRSAKALAIAESNAMRHSVAGSISFVESDWCAELSKLNPPYDCIVANPPYIDPGEETPIELSFEPSEALFSPDYGLSDTLRILQEGLPLLKVGGVLLCEVGAGKRALLNEFFSRSDHGIFKFSTGSFKDNFSVELLGDDSQADRFSVVRVCCRT